MLEECAERYGDIFTLRLPLFGTFIVLSSPDDIRDIFKAAPGTYDNGGPYSFIAQAFGPESLLAMTGEPHLHERALISPHLHGERMRAWGEKIRNAAASHLMVVPKEQPVSLLSIIETITFEVSASLAMGLTPGEPMDELLGQLKRARNPMIDILMRFLFSRFSPNPGTKEVLASIQQEIDRRRSAKNSDTPRQDLLDVFIHSRTLEGNPMPDAQIKAEVHTMLNAGYTTIAAATAWAIALILENPAAREKIEAELSSNSASDLAGNKTDYLDAAIKESLRIRPVVPMVFRRLAEPRQLGGFLLPAGVTLVPCIYLAHSSSRSWPEPKRFLPERFLDSGAIDQSVWLPFGGGHRRCIGASFALMEMRILIASLMARRPVFAQNDSAASAVHKRSRRFTRPPSPDLKIIFTK
jgi:cytochrome P450